MKGNREERKLHKAKKNNLNCMPRTSRGKSREKKRFEFQHANHIHEENREDLKAPAVATETRRPYNK